MRLSLLVAVLTMAGCAAVLGLDDGREGGEGGSTATGGGGTGGVATGGFNGDGGEQAGGGGSGGSASSSCYSCGADSGYFLRFDADDAPVEANMRIHSWPSVGGSVVLGDYLGASSAYAHTIGSLGPIVSFDPMATATEVALEGTSDGPDLSDVAITVILLADTFVPPELDAYLIRIGSAGANKVSIGMLPTGAYFVGVRGVTGAPDRLTSSVMGPGRVVVGAVHRQDGENGEHGISVNGDFQQDSFSGHSVFLDNGAVISLGLDTLNQTGSFAPWRGGLKTVLIYNSVLAPAVRQEIESCLLTCTTAP